MEIELRFFGPFRGQVGEKTIEREMPEDATVGAVLSNLTDEIPALEGLLRDADGELSDSVNVTVNKRNVKQLDGSETLLTDGDVLRLAPPVAGG